MRRKFISINKKFEMTKKSSICRNLSLIDIDQKGIKNSAIKFFQNRYQFLNSLSTVGARLMSLSHLCGFKNDCVSNSDTNSVAVSIAGLKNCLSNTRINFPRYILFKIDINKFSNQRVKLTLNASRRFVEAETLCGPSSCSFQKPALFLILFFL